MCYNEELILRLCNSFRIIYNIPIHLIVFQHADPGSIPDSTTFQKSLSIAYISFIFCYFLISFYIFNLLNYCSLSIDDEDRLSTQECIC